MKKNVLIIEDNKASMDALVELTKECDSTSVIYCADTSAMAYKYAMENSIDLFLIDIMLDKNVKGDVSGMKFAETIRRMDNYKFTPMIFVTALEDQARNAFHNLHSYEYIEKPFDFDRVRNTISDALQFPKEQERKNRYIYYRKDGILFSLDTEKIMYIEVVGRKLRVCMTDENIEISYRTCSSMMNELDSENFLQSSRSTIVNRKYIKYVDEANRYIGMKDGTQLEIGKTRKKKFLKELNYGYRIY